MGRLIDADICLNKAWQSFYKQEDEHEKNIDDYDIMRDQYYEQSGFECCQQTIVNAPTVEAIPKDQYEARLKVDLMAILEDLDLQIDEFDSGCGWDGYIKKIDVQELIQQKINELKGDQEGEHDRKSIDQVKKSPFKYSDTANGSKCTVV